MIEPIASPEVLQEILYQEEPAPEVWGRIKKVLGGAFKARRYRSKLSPEKRRKIKTENQKRAHLRDQRFRLIYSAKKRAKERHLPFNLDLDDIKIPVTCPVLGIVLRVGTRQKKDHAPTLDRIKPELGYTKGNVRVISWRANSLRSDGTLEEMQKVVAYIRSINA